MKVSGKNIAIIMLIIICLILFMQLGNDDKDENEVKDIYKGTQCITCNGTGEAECMICKGMGKIKVDGDVVECFVCRGAGHRFCYKCDGDGVYGD